MKSLLYSSITKRSFIYAIMRNHSKNGSRKSSWAWMVSFTTHPLLPGSCHHRLLPFLFLRKLFEWKNLQFWTESQSGCREISSIPNQPHFTRKELINWQEDGRRSYIHNSGECIINKENFVIQWKRNKYPIKKRKLLVTRPNIKSIHKFLKLTSAMYFG